MRKYVAEFIGTIVLTTFGCGSAAISGGIEGTLGILGIAMAFGLSIVAMAYAIGDVSGCHINPAVSLGVFLSGGMSAKDFGAYLAAQFLGGIAGAGILYGIISCSGLGPVAETGLVIGLTRAFVHILGIPLTGTSVNPARSFGPALLVGNGVALGQVWVFIVAPLIGAAIAAGIYKTVCRAESE